jgi:uncharacterized protein
MMPVAYVDTSAFIKRFLSEDNSAEMEALATSNTYQLAISSLTVTEFRSVMKRCLRLGTTSTSFTQKATEQLLQEIASGALRFHIIDAAIFNLAGELIEGLTSPLGTLDAIHLACAKATGAVLMVSSDRQLLRAAEESSMKILDLSSQNAF